MGTSKINKLSSIDLEIATIQSTLEMFLTKNAKKHNKLKDIDKILLGLEDDDEFEEYMY